MKRVLVIACCAVIFGCANRAVKENTSPVPSISPQAKHYLDKPVNCNTAKRDIEILEQEHASVGKQMLAGVRAVMPLSMVAGIITNDYNDRFAVAAGDYNADIEAKIKDIKSTCHIQ